MATTNALVTAEQAFAKSAANHGTRAAFLQFLAHDSILFRPEPVDGQTWFGQQQDNPGLLSWRPEFTEMAASGDLGYTTGPWHFRNPSNADPIQFGQYVSVWRYYRQSGWKVVLDAGITCPPSVDDRASKRVTALMHDTMREGVSGADLMQVEARLGELAYQDGYLAAVQKMGVAETWILRTGHLPQQGFSTLAEELSSQPGQLEWEINGADVARSGDLGYVFGTSREQISERLVVRSSFLRIWRWGNQECWELALDIDNPFPTGT